MHVMFYPWLGQWSWQIRRQIVPREVSSGTTVDQCLVGVVQAFTVMTLQQSCVHSLGR